MDRADEKAKYFYVTEDGRLKTSSCEVPFAGQREVRAVIAQGLRDMQRETAEECIELLATKREVSIGIIQEHFDLKVNHERRAEKTAGRSEH